MRLTALAVMLATLVSYVIHYYMHVNFLECNFVETAHNMARKLIFPGDNLERDKAVAFFRRVLCLTQHKQSAIQFHYSGQRYS